MFDRAEIYFEKKNYLSALCILSSVYETTPDANNSDSHILNQLRTEIAFW